MTAPDPARPTRSAENWLLDAATYARDGDIDQAIAATKRALEALQKLKLDPAKAE